MAPAENNAEFLLARARRAASRQVMQELLPSKAKVSIDGVGTRQLEQLLPAAFELRQANIN